VGVKLVTQQLKKTLLAIETLLVFVFNLLLLWLQ